MTHFGFVKNPTLRNNLDIAFAHVLTLIPLSESSSYKPIEKSSFRKSIIITTAGIIEALLCSIVSERCTHSDLTLQKWELENRKELYKVDNSYFIVGGDYKLKSTIQRLDKMNMAQIDRVLHDKKIVTDNLFDKLERIRDLRNEQHFGTQTIVREYSNNDLEFVFSVAKEVKILAQKYS